MKVKAYVHVISEDGSQRAVLAPGDTVPDWASVTHPDAVDSDSEDKAEAASAEEPKVESTPDTKRSASRKAPARK